MSELRVFIAETDGAWEELTAGERQVVRISAADLQEAARRRRKLPADVAVVLDLAVSVADDPRTALAAISDHDGDAGVCYAGTVDGLAGLVADLVVAGVADGVTLIPVGPDDQRRWARAALSRIQDRLRIRAA
jgi:alkanesulfonate monooxygenase SsuD/methylene tetrahydromethanopterin reductase-like flavin-dependent oxidoreductase (luciferase family)